jgi:hypothetical protein
MNRLLLLHHRREHRPRRNKSWILTSSKIQNIGDTHFSSGDDDDSVIPAKPLDSHPPLRAGKKILPKFGLDAS